MNLLRKLSFSLVFVLAALSLRAQAVIDLSAYIDDETAAQLGDNNAAARGFSSSRRRLRSPTTGRSIRG